MSLFSRWFGGQHSSDASQAPRRRIRPRIESLEARDVPTNDIFTVVGPANTQVALEFNYASRNSPFFDELGVYVVQDDQGRVAGLLPTDKGYGAAALESARMIFETGEIVGTTVTQSFAAGTRLAFYVVRANTSDNWLLKNSRNLTTKLPQAFFSIDLANNDDLDHARVQTYGDKSIKLFWETSSGLSNQSFRDDIIKISYAAQQTSLAPGLAGQTVPTEFKLVGRSTEGQHTVGMFRVDDANGRIGTLNPGDVGWVRAALTNATRESLFDSNTPLNTAENVNIPGGTFFGVYMIRNGGVAKLLETNPRNTRFGKVQAFFSFNAANPDGKEHVRWLDNNRFAFEDSLSDRDRDFNDAVVKITYGTPPNAAPTVVGTGNADVTVAQNAADRIIDLAGFFDDVDLANHSKIRIVTNLGNIDMELFDREAPRTVANIFQYIDDNKYDSSIFHRRANNVDASGTTDADVDIIQAGAFKFTGDNSDTTLDADLTDIVVDEQVQNEFTQVNLANVRGTVAMAKVGGQPNSATSQFFFNTSDNTTVLGAGNNGGFTVFGTVIGTSMSVVDNLTKIPTQSQSDFDSALGELPLRNNYTETGGTSFPEDTVAADYAFIQDVQILSQPEELTYTVTMATVAGTNTDPGLVTVSIIQGHRLKIEFANTGEGTVDITVTAKDKANNTVTDTFRVTVGDGTGTPPAP